MNKRAGFGCSRSFRLAPIARTHASPPSLRSSDPVFALIYLSSLFAVVVLLPSHLPAPPFPSLLFPVRPCCSSSLSPPPTNVSFC